MELTLWPFYRSKNVVKLWVCIEHQNSWFNVSQHPFFDFAMKKYIIPLAKCTGQAMTEACGDLSSVKHRKIPTTKHQIDSQPAICQKPERYWTLLVPLYIFVPLMRC